MKISLKNAKLLQTLLAGESIASSQMNKALRDLLLNDGVIGQRVSGRTKKTLFFTNVDTVSTYLKNQFGISDIAGYIELLENENATKADAVEASSNSKIKSIRSFSGFPIRVVEEITVQLDGKAILLSPQNGIFTFVSNWEAFTVPTDVTIIGVENGETFSKIENYSYLFENNRCIFVSRYPQSNDLRNWLLSISNNYIHFGDFDIAGVALYYNEIKQYVGTRAHFFVPKNIEENIERFGNRGLFDTQYHLLEVAKRVDENGVKLLLEYLVKYKRCVEQELFSRG